MKTLGEKLGAQEPKTWEKETQEAEDKKGN